MAKPKPTRRDFLLSATACAGSALLAGCSGGGGGAQTSASPSPTPTAAPPTSTPETPTPAPADPTPVSSPPTPPANPPPPASPPDATVRLRDYLRANAVDSLALTPAASQKPTISWAGALTNLDSAPTSLPDGVIVAASDALIRGPVRGTFSRSLPGDPMVAGYPCLAATRNYVCKGQARVTRSLNVLRFETDAAVVEIAGVVPDGSQTVQTLIVDGKLVPAKVLSCTRAAAPGGWSTGAIRIDFGSHARRNVWIETVMNAAYVKIGRGDSMFALDDSAEPQMTVVGDSYLQSRSGSFGNGGAIALELGARLGIRNVAIDAIGGTGYWNSGGGLGNLNDRLQAHAADKSAVYVVLSGINDYGDFVDSANLAWPSRSTYEAAVRSYLAGLRTARPDSLIVVAAPFCPVPPMSDASYVANTGTNSSGIGDNLYKASVHKQAVRAIAGPWVYVDVLMGGGWLNSSGATGDVTNLQWFTGGTPGSGTTATYRPGNVFGGGGGGFGGIANVPILTGGRYMQAPEINVTGGTGRGLLLASTVDGSGALSSIVVVCPGSGYTAAAGLPTITVDRAFEVAPASLGTPSLIAGVNPGGQYPLPSFAPPGASSADLNNVYTLLNADMTHPSPLGVEYLSRRLAENIYQAVMAL